MPHQGPKTWTTPEEEAFLQSQLPAYIACQATKIYHNFWNTMTCEFLNRWPERACLTDIPQDVELNDIQKSRVAQAILKRQSVSCIIPSRNTYLIEKIEVLKNWFWWHTNVARLARCEEVLVSG